MARTMQRKVVSESEQPTTEKAQKKEFAQSDGIKCHSVVQGGLYYEGSKTGMLYSFSDYGDVTEIEYRDLVAAVRTKSEYVYNPYFIIDDEDFLAEFPAVEKFYNDQISIKDLKAILDLDIPKMTDAIQSLPKAAVESLKKIASTQIANGRLDSVKKIRALDELFGTDLNLLGELFSEQ